MHEGFSLAGLQTTVQCLFGMSSVDWAYRGQQQQVPSPTSNLRQTASRSRPSVQNVCLSTRDPRSSIYRQPQSGQAVQTTCPESDWTIKPYISRCAQSHTIRSPHTCRFTPCCGQLALAAHPPVSSQPPVVPSIWTIEPSADPWSAAWDTEAPDELKKFLLEVLLTPIQTSKRSCTSGQHQQNLSVPAPAPDFLSKATSPVDIPTGKGDTTAEAEAATAPGSSEHPSVSLDTVTDRNADSGAATSTAAFSHASSAQQRDAPKALLQTPSSRKRSRAGSEQTDAQIAPDTLHSQPTVGRPPKKVRQATGSKSAAPVPSSDEIAQAAKDGIVFAKFARFAPWPAQGNYQYVSLDKIIPFEAGCSKHKSGKSSLDIALKEATAYLKARVAG